MRQGVLIVSGLGVLLGLFYLLEATRYARGTMAQPGPGLYPVLVGALLVLGFAGSGVETLLSRSHAVVDWPEADGRWRLVVMVAATLGYVALVHYIGHPIAATLITIIVLQVMGMSSWLLKIGLAVGVSLASYFLFASVLGVPLPRGIWWE